MLYDALHERILKKGYQVKYVSVHQPGRNLKYVPVYRSPSGEEAFEDEATVAEIAIAASCGPGKGGSHPLCDAGNAIGLFNDSE